MMNSFFSKALLLFLFLKLCNCWTDGFQQQELPKSLDNKPNQNLDQFVSDFGKFNQKEKEVVVPVQNPNKFNKPIFSYVGCFADRREARDIYEKEYTYITKFNKTLPTVELCVNLCAQDGYTVAGIQAFDECYCGNTYGRYNATEENNCFFQCAGKYTCGGYNANSVYFISSFQIAGGRENDRSLMNAVPNNPCASSPCLNSGMCITLMDDKGVPRGYICRCTNPQDTGVFCEERNFCHSNPCLNGAICTNTFTGFICKCSSGWTGFNCNTPLNLPSSKVESFNCFQDGNHCRNGGTCFKLMDSSYMCKCPGNYKGIYCEIFDMCSTLPCQNGGECTFKETNGFYCNCTKDFYGQKCEFKNTCSDFECYNGGECSMDSLTHKKFCSCPNNFAGIDCRECKPQFSGENCELCASGYFGLNCEQTINQCSPNPCLNGVCASDDSSYKCVCSEGWKGRNCTEKNCLIKSCLNEGVCTSKYDSVNKVMDFRCECPPNYHGDQCEFLDPNPCVSQPCQNDEECVLQQDNTFICVKSIDFCERVKPCNNFSECVYSKDNNTFYCKCLNGEKYCDESDYKVKNSSEPIQIYNMEPKMSGKEITGAIKTAQEEKNTKSQGQKLKFSYDNIYLILPLGLIVVVILAISTVFGYFGIRSRRRRADFESSKPDIRTINYMNDNAAFNDTIYKPVISNSSNEFANTEKEFAESYDRV
ncbi:unnamed protein product [Brachionus calyciflorus]|uniref:Uncharacterized protein n=1 Tax=Brachionus calyciflorus TaxID=104777 RepID=A0A813MXG0_9BILA|nr:unnamed protein product [Brachionus calyciflorus]